jgi:hypothetical protein
LELPSENTLCTKCASRISQLQDDLTDLTRIEKVMADYIAHYPSFPEFLLCTFWTDAFTVDPNSPQPKQLISDIQGVREKTANGADSEANNSFFLIQLTPWDRKFRVSPTNLINAANGTASPTICRVLDEASYFNECFAS